MNSRQNESGFSLVEAMIAMVLIVVAFATLAQFGSINTQRIRYAVIEACHQTAQSTMNGLRGVGFEDNMAPLNYNTNIISYNPHAKTTNKFDDRDIWPRSQQIPIVAGTPGNLISNAQYALIGSISMLAGVYQRHPASCSPEGIAYSGGQQEFALNDVIDGQFNNVQTRLRIERFYLQQGTKDCLPVYPIPAGNDRNSPTYLKSNNVLDLPTGFSDEHGFWVTVTTTYENGTGEEGRCSVSGLFQYPMLQEDSSMESFVPSFAFGKPSPDWCDKDMPGGTFTLTLAKPPEAEGWTTLCRDNSTGGHWDASPAICPEFPADSVGLVDNQGWVRCEEVTVCGVRPSGASWNGSTLTVQYPPLKWGCLVNLESRVVDLALNQSSVKPVTSAYGTPTCRQVCPPSRPRGTDYCRNPDTLYSDCLPPLPPLPPPCFGMSCGGGPGDGGTDGGGGDGDGIGDGGNGHGNDGGGSSDGGDSGF